MLCNKKSVSIFVSIALSGILHASQLAPKALVAPGTGSSSSSTTVSAPVTMSVIKAAVNETNVAQPTFFYSEDGLLARAYWEAACSGDIEAQFCIACYYAEGRGIKRDDAKAFYWFEKASTKGDISARIAVAVCYWLGIGVKADVRAAIRRLTLLDLEFQKNNKKWRLKPACYALAKIYNQLTLDPKVSLETATLYQKTSWDYGNAAEKAADYATDYLDYWEKTAKLCRAEVSETSAKSDARAEEVAEEEAYIDGLLQEHYACLLPCSVRV